MSTGGDIPQKRQGHTVTNSVKLTENRTVTVKVRGLKSGCLHALPEGERHCLWIRESAPQRTSACGSIRE